MNPPLSCPASVSANNHSVDRHRDLLGDSVQAIRTVVNNLDFVDKHVLSSYLDKIKSLKGKLLGLKKNTLPHSDVEERV